ncbi:MAG: CDP-archaeol synthase [bacterium]|nr:CDP-archaeol synthase [bacterium]
MPGLLIELLWLLPWCWTVNMSLNLLGYAKHIYPEFSRLDRAFDGRVRLPDGNRLLGDSTTWFGLVLVGALGVFGEYAFADHHFFLLAILTFFGHALGSFVKRRFGMQHGAYVPFVDHADYILCVGLVFVVSGYLSVTAAFVALALTLVLTPLVTLSAFQLGLRARKF